MREFSLLVVGRELMNYCVGVVGVCKCVCGLRFWDVGVFGRLYLINSRGIIVAGLLLVVTGLVGGSRCGL